jgi:dihydroxy-acid dehydratase
VHEGDTIRIDIPAKSIALEVPQAEIEARLAGWQPPAPRIDKGYMARYARMVSSASQGAVVSGA